MAKKKKRGSHPRSTGTNATPQSTPKQTSATSRHAQSKPSSSQAAMKELSPPKWSFGQVMAIVLGVVTVGAGIWAFFGQPTPAIQLLQASTLGAPVYPMGDTPQGGTGQPIDGIRCDTAENTVYHVHAHLSLFVNGKQIAVPAGIGIEQPQLQNGFVSSGSCFYWLHTHDASGIIHIESPKETLYTLGNFFDIWGRPLSGTNLLGHPGPVTAYVNGQRFTGNPRTITLTTHKSIVLTVGTTSPLWKPPTYQFPSELPQ